MKRGEQKLKTICQLVHICHRVMLESNTWVAIARDLKKSLDSEGEPMWFFEKRRIV